MKLVVIITVFVIVCCSTLVASDPLPEDLARYLAATYGASALTSLQQQIQNEKSSGLALSQTQPTGYGSQLNNANSQSNYPMLQKAANNPGNVFKPYENGIGVPNVVLPGGSYNQPVLQTDYANVKHRAAYPQDTQMVNQRAVLPTVPIQKPLGQAQQIYSIPHQQNFQDIRPLNPMQSPVHVLSPTRDVQQVAPMQVTENNPSLKIVSQPFVPTTTFQNPGRQVTGLPLTQQQLFSTNQQSLVASRSQVPVKENIGFLSGNNRNVENIKRSPVIQQNKLTPHFQVVQRPPNQLPINPQAPLQSHISSVITDPEIQKIISKTKLQKRYLVVHPNGTVEHMDSLENIIKANPNYVLINSGPKSNPAPIQTNGDIKTTGLNSNNKVTTPVIQNQNEKKIDHISPVVSSSATATTNNRNSNIMKLRNESKPKIEAHHVTNFMKTSEVNKNTQIPQRTFAQSSAVTSGEASKIIQVLQNPKQNKDTGSSSMKVSKPTASATAKVVVQEISGKETPKLPKSGKKSAVIFSVGTTPPHTVKSSEKKMSLKVKVSERKPQIQMQETNAAAIATVVKSPPPVSKTTKQEKLPLNKNSDIKLITSKATSSKVTKDEQQIKIKKVEPHAEIIKKPPTMSKYMKRKNPIVIKKQTNNKDAKAIPVKTNLNVKIPNSKETNKKSNVITKKVTVNTMSSNKTSSTNKTILKVNDSNQNNTLKSSADTTSESLDLKIIPISSKKKISTLKTAMNNAAKPKNVAGKDKINKTDNKCKENEPKSTTIRTVTAKQNATKTKSINKSSKIHQTKTKATSIKSEVVKNQDAHNEKLKKVSISKSEDNKTQKSGKSTVKRTKNTTEIESNSTQTNAHHRNKTEVYEEQKMKMLSVLSNLTKNYQKDKIVVFQIVMPPVIERDVHTTVYPNGTIIDEIMETIWEDDDLYTEPTILTSRTIRHIDDDPEKEPE